MVLATASKDAITLVTESIQGNALPVMYLLGEKYVNAISDLAQSDNAKTLVLPADLLNTVKGLMGK